MALPAAPSFASFDVLDRTQGRSVHNVLLDAMFSKSRFLEVLGAGPTINQQRHEWISLGANAQTVTVSNTTETTIDSSGDATNVYFECSAADAAKLLPGTLLMNQTRATPIGTYQRNEIMQVTAVSAANVVTVVRDIGAFNSGTGSAVHAVADVLRIIGAPLQEGSLASADPNGYVADTILENYSHILAMKMQLTGSQKARAMEVVDSEIERQWQRELIHLKNKRANLFLYGFGSSTAVGSDTVIRSSKGLLDFMVDNIVAANALVDYTTTTLTYDAINALFIKLFNNGADPSEPYKIVTSATTKDVISSWDADKVRTVIDNEKVGREISVFKSSLGFQAEIIADTAVQKNDVFIIQPEKVMPFTFRPFTKEEWGRGTSAPNGDDMWYQRTLGEEGLMVLDPGTAHAAITYLTWV
jgi:hypothetical protein